MWQDPGSDYLKNMKCSWVLQVPATATYMVCPHSCLSFEAKDGKALQIRIIAFDFEASSCRQVADSVLITVADVLSSATIG